MTDGEKQYLEWLRINETITELKRKSSYLIAKDLDCQMVELYERFKG